MDINKLQNDMQTSYYGGGPGMFASGIIWIVAAIAMMQYTTETSIIILFFGGMLIHPLGIAGSKLLKRSGKHKEGNPLAYLAMESTLILFVGLLIAYYFYNTESKLFYPIMLLIIGVRYVLFQTIYGMKIYWILGVGLTLLGTLCLMYNLTNIVSAFLGGITELIFAVVIMLKSKE